MYKLGLNFIKLKNQNVSFLIYRKARASTDKRKSNNTIFGNRLPEVTNDDIYHNYWVSFEPQDGFEEFKCNLDTNHNLSKRFISNTILNFAKKADLEKHLIKDAKSKYNRINFILKEHPEGKETVWLEPYYFNRTKEFGFLIDYRFLKNDKTEFNRKLQILSLSLNSIGRSNTQLASDKYKKIQDFARKFYSKLFKNEIIDFESVAEVDSSILDSKSFLCKDRTVISHQSKMRQIGPIKGVVNPINIIFLHKYSERKILATFYQDLESELINVFGCDVNFVGHKCSVIDINSINAVKQAINDNGYENVIIIVLKKNESEDNEMYYRVKYEFTISDIPVQFINYNTLKNKYSVRDFSLQIFSKVGGVPWIVDTSNRKNLIIGLAQSIRFLEVEGERRMKRYYAYSIIMDNSGLFHSINIVSENQTKEDYLENLRQNLSKIIKENKDIYSNIVLHAPFRISREEIKKIETTVKAVSPDISFSVLKLNQFNKYYGYNKNVNSLIPYESSLMLLGEKEYLLWTEGITKFNKNPNKRYSGPILVEILYETKEGQNHQNYMQDLINLSGMNWRAYNSKSVPLSIQYCNLVTNFIQEFQERGYPKLTEDNLKLWFL